MAPKVSKPEWKRFKTVVFRTQRVSVAFDVIYSHEFVAAETL